MELQHWLLGKDYNMSYSIGSLLSLIYTECRSMQFIHVYTVCLLATLELLHLRWIAAVQPRSTKLIIVIIIIHIHFLTEIVLLRIEAVCREDSEEM